MDLETENRIATILLKEAAELRRQAEKEGVLAYIKQPNARRRPNSRFLTATVLGMQQANRAVEVNEMWQSRQKELELDNKLKGKSKYSGQSSISITRTVGESFSRSASRGCDGIDNDSRAASSSSKNAVKSYSWMEEDGLGDEDIEEFLNSRVKRGRGSIGPRMDETGPYLPRDSDDQDGAFASTDMIREERRCLVLGPEKPSSWKTVQSSEDEQDDDHKCRKKHKDCSSGRSKKEHSRKHKGKDKSREKKRKKEEEEKRHKHH